MTPDRRVPQSHLALQCAEAVRSADFVFSNGTNYPGTRTNEHALHLIDRTDAIVATRFASAAVTAAAMAGVSSECPIRSDMSIETVASVLRAGRTDMIMRVDVPIPVVETVDEHAAYSVAVQIRRAVLARTERSRDIGDCSSVCSPTGPMIDN